MKPSILYLILILSIAALPAHAVERLLYSTTLHDWGAHPSVLTPDSLCRLTQYSEERLTFTFQQVLIRQDGCSSSFYEGVVHPLAMTERKATPYIVTSPLASVTRLRMMQGATGGNCGFRVEAWGDEDEGWVTLHDARLGSGLHEHEIAVNRHHVRLRLSNLSSSQNAYLFELDLYGEVEAEKHPRLESFGYDGQTYAPGGWVKRNDEEVLEGTVKLSKRCTFPSEQHPLTDLSVLGGELMEVRYEATSALQCDVCVRVANRKNKEEQWYRIHFVGKPDHKLTYRDASGQVLAEQWVEEDAAIGSYGCAAELLPVADGQRMRGWFEQPRTGHAIGTSHVVSGAMDLYARISDVEGPSGHRRWNYDLRNPDFDPDHHEAFNPVGAHSYRGRSHGWLFEAGAMVELLVGPEAYIALGLCRQQPELRATTTLLVGNDTLRLTPEHEGELQLYHYCGEAGRLQLRFIEPTTLHSLAIDNVADRPIVADAAGYYHVQAGDAEHLLTTLDVVNMRNASPEAAPARIFLPDGDYDLGVTSLSPISGHNISLIGQSTEGTVIHNLPWIEGIGTATLLNLGDNNYLQDLTLKNDLDYYADTEAGRAPCLQDFGTHTICKQVKMLSYQDTYYSSGDGQQLYWEDCELHGAFDFLCGRGTVFYNRIHLVLESMERELGQGEAIITAPYTNGSDMGYVFDHCRVTVKSRTFNWGRAWGGRSHCAFLYTQIPSDDQLIPTRYEPEGMNAAATDFYEYQTRDAEGRLVTPQSNIVHFTHQNGDQTFETILTDEQAKSYALDSIFTDWHPDAETQQKVAQRVRLRHNVLQWKNEGSAVAMILLDDEPVAWVTGNQYRFGQPTEGHRVGVRLANSRGGFGPTCAPSTR